MPRLINKKIFNDKRKPTHYESSNGIFDHLSFSY
jgi:hypothetical protein